MNFEFIERRKTGDKVVKFGGVGITDEEIVNDMGKRSGVGVDWWEESWQTAVRTERSSALA